MESATKTPKNTKKSAANNIADYGKMLPNATEIEESVLGALMIDGTAIDTDWTGTLATGSVVLTELNTNVAAEGTQEAIDQAIKDLEAGTLHVFDTANFTVGGETLTSYQADVDTDPAYTPDTEVIADGYFHESEKRSAPYFDLRIDGITLLDEAYG